MVSLRTCMNKSDRNDLMHVNSYALSSLTFCHFDRRDCKTVRYAAKLPKIAHVQLVMMNANLNVFPLKVSVFFLKQFA